MKIFPSGMQLLILQLLADGRGRYGLELVRESNGKLKRGTIYTTLYRMQKEGWLIPEQDMTPGLSGIPKTRYSLSEKGGRILGAVAQL